MTLIRIHIYFLFNLPSNQNRSELCVEQPKERKINVLHNIQEVFVLNKKLIIINTMRTMKVKKNNAIIIIFIVQQGSCIQFP